VGRTLAINFNKTAFLVFTLIPVVVFLFVCVLNVSLALRIRSDLIRCFVIITFTLRFSSGLYFCS